MRVLFCNIGWMKNYNGQSKDDKIVNGGAFVNKNKDGSEVYNFKNRNGYYYGYVTHKHQMKLERFKGITEKDKSVDDVLVIWVAKENGQCSKIVGWYKNATVYREYKNIRYRGRRGYYLGNLYRVKANVLNSTLLPVSKRTFNVPRASKAKDKVGMGQANIWYADEEKDQAFVEDVIKYIESYKGEKQNKL